MLCTGFTDSVYLREAGTPTAYGFSPFRSTSAEVLTAGFHNADERVHVDDLLLSVEFHVALARELLSQTDAVERPEGVAVDERSGHPVLVAAEQDRLERRVRDPRRGLGEAERAGGPPAAGAVVRRVALQEHGRRALPLGLGDRRREQRGADPLALVGGGHRERAEDEHVDERALGVDPGPAELHVADDAVELAVEPRPRGWPGCCPSRRAR